MTQAGPARRVGTGPSLQFHVRGEAQKLKKPIAQVGL